MPWYKGNPHTHTNRSDGKSDIYTAVKWYAEHGYDWLAITDHNIGLDADFAEFCSKKYNILVIPGIELGGDAHIVGLGTQGDNDKPDLYCNRPMKEILQSGIDWIRERGGVPILAHPNRNYEWNEQDFLATGDCCLFEVFNGAPETNSFAAGGKPGTDDIWNGALNKGRVLFGVGSDDTHNYDAFSFHARHQISVPGYAWTYVECEECTQQFILSAMESGRIVASSGAAPLKMTWRDNIYAVEIFDVYKPFRFTVEFFGAGGLLAQEYGRKVHYAANGSEKWIRARVFCSSGRYMWLQPVFLDG